jgi:hypothetical protein
MKCHLILYDKQRAKPPAYIWLANGEKAIFLTGQERDEQTLHGLVIGSVTPPLGEWPARLAMVIKARMQT